MAPIPVTETFYAADRAEWRAWLAEHHAAKTEIWLIGHWRTTKQTSISYLDAVEEALCFGWIDSTVKKFDAERSVQRFSPRRPKSNWTELNKHRVRRLIADGLMTEAGLAVLPDITLRPLALAPDILAALQADPQVWVNFQAFPDIYQRIRINAIEQSRADAEQFNTRLSKFIDKTRQNKLFGGWE